jgi:murein endopeptidase
MCILEREREHIGSIWSRVCPALLLVATQSLERRAPGDYRSLRRLTVAIGNKQIIKQYTKQCLITKQTVPKDATHRYKCMRARIT